MKESVKNIVLIAALFLSTVFIFYLIVTKIDLLDAIRILKDVDRTVLTVCMVISVLVNILLYAYVRKVIWRCLKHEIPFKDLVYVRLGSVPFKYLPMFKNTDILSAIYLKKYRNTTVTEGILTNVIATLFDLIALLLIFIIGYVISGQHLEGLSNYQQYLKVVFFLFLFLVLFLYSFLINQKVGKKFLFHLFLGRQSKYLQLLQDKMEAWKNLHFSRNLLLLFYAALFQSSEFIIFYLFAASFGIYIPVTIVLLLVPLVIIISQLPVSLCGFGLKEGTYVVFFLSFATKETLLALGLLVFFANQLLPILIGLFFTYSFIHKLKPSEIKELKNEN